MRPIAAFVTAVGLTTGLLLPAAEAPGPALRQVPAAEAFQRRFPEETILIAYRKDGKAYVKALGNRAFQSFVAIPKKDPACEAIAQTGEFSIGYPGEDLEEPLAAAFAGETDAQKLGLTVSRGHRTAAPILDSCILSYECRVTGKVDAGDSILFVGDTVGSRHSGKKVSRLYLVGYRAGQPVFRAFPSIRGPGAPRYEKYPEQVVMIVSADKGGKPNIMPASWTMRVSDDPPMIAVSIGKSRYSHDLIAARKQFVYAYPGEDLVEEVLYCGTHSGRDGDKFQALKLQTQPAAKVDVPLPSQCLAAFECAVKQQIDDGSHTVFVGTVEAAHVSDKDVPRLYNLGTESGDTKNFKGLPALPADAGPATSTAPSTRPAQR